MRPNRNNAVAQPVYDTVELQKGTVTQITTTATGVTIHATSGVITCVTSTAAASTPVTFTVTNSRVVATSVILVGVCDYSGAIDGTEGEPKATVDNITAGAFDITVWNHDASHQLNGIVKIAFAIVA